MVEPASPYAARLQAAMRAAGKNPEDRGTATWLAQRLEVTYQAARKAISGETKMLTAENNVRAARALGVDSEWLATGDGSMLQPVTKLTEAEVELISNCRRLDPERLEKVVFLAEALLPPAPQPTAQSESSTRPAPQSAP